ncbi:BrxA/BrxB family bacilliredoxin [Allokutzneria oryzae]|uniref:BrxA/BrxB family bacilliredoxin n=1 Tax=Allokutzneria oryzae TaxID=1378989 RepID=A0ABV5ZU59_9PSEU
MPFNPLLVKPMRDELAKLGFEDLLTPEAVDTAMENAKTGRTLAVLNYYDRSAETARTAVGRALERTTLRPEQLVTVFDEQDIEATARIRSYFPEIPPSSPSFAFFIDGELVAFVPRHRIEGRDPDSVAEELTAALNESYE